MTAVAIPREFIWRRLHSLMGLWLVLFLLEHLITNSQAALLLGENGQGFVKMVNGLHNLPYLEAIEIFLLGTPIAIHLFWGIKYLLTAKSNASVGAGNKPRLAEYGRNRAYTWQRITSWILVFGLIGHIVKFRFLDYPWSVNQGKDSSYFVRLHMDNGLYTLSDRLGFKVFDASMIGKERQALEMRKNEEALVEIARSVPPSQSYDPHLRVILAGAQSYEQRAKWVAALEKKPLLPGEVIAAADNFGTASLLTVRDTFKSPLYVGLYTVFVLAACFHAFNGLWTFLITWGIVLKMSAQKSGVAFCYFLMALLALLGLAAVWGTYWVNLKS